MPFYNVSLDDASEGRMLIVERWQGEKALKAHLQTQKTKLSWPNGQAG